jgi:Stigma-specific protein, Stig1
MNTKTSWHSDIIPIRCLVLPILLSLAGCFTAPSPEVGKLKCTTDQQCPTGYSCLAPNQVGGCCRPGTPCPVTLAVDGSNFDMSPADQRIASEIRPMGIDQSSGEDGGMADVKSSGGSGGSTSLAVDGASSGGAGGGGGGGGSAQSDANLSDSLADLPVPDVAIEGLVRDVPAADATIDAPGTCSVDKDCPAATPLCLASKCAKCATDTDCAGRSGPACETSSGLCVACTGDKHCTGIAAKCNTTTNQCTGCLARSDCSGTCQTCTSGVCASVKNQDDPGVCAGTCDSSGACKAKQGQTCQAAADCAGGLPCADGHCCNSACTGSCEACSVSGSLGTCTPLPAGTAPYPNHPSCVANDPSCAGSCQGSRACTYPTSGCGTASCNTTYYQAAGTCSGGACNTPGVQSCSYACVVSLGGCTGVCPPSASQCSSSGIPQKCSSSGQWQDQTACTSLQYCSGGGCLAKFFDGVPCTSSAQCRSGLCTGNVCCEPGFAGCNGGCANIATDNNNCGGCGIVCGAGLNCCSGTCTDPQIDSNNCGGCNNACGGNQVCSAGVCLKNHNEPCNTSSECLPAFLCCTCCGAGTPGFVGRCWTGGECD